MLKCEIDKNIVTQMVDIYVFDEDTYIKYNGDGDFDIQPRDPYVIGGIEPYMSIRYDIWDKLLEAFKIELKVEKIEGSTSHIKDLRWVLSHFLNKDKK